ncbi:MAG: ECF transporter S component, partial [Bifidobacteriaceae bacterium]|nr:ECF transporter S component [Bifidobacteriaceae bacterium]
MPTSVSVAAGAGAKPGLLTSIGGLFARSQVARRTAASVFFVALGLVLPLATPHIPAVGNALLPMHIPVLLCGLLCGWQYGAVVGLILPLLSSGLTGMPPMLPIGLGMCVELAVYGLVSGLLGQYLPKRLG